MRGLNAENAKQQMVGARTDVQTMSVVALLELRRPSVWRDDVAQRPESTNCGTLKSACRVASGNVIEDVAQCYKSSANGTELADSVEIESMFMRSGIGFGMRFHNTGDLKIIFEIGSSNVR